MSAYLNWNAGMKVECIGDFAALASTEWAIVFGVEFPEAGSVYTIREIVAVAPDSEEEGSIGIRLKEILNMPNPCTSAAGLVDREIVFHPHDFRPLQTSASDISIFTAILRGARVSEDA